MTTDTRDLRRFFSEFRRFAFWALAGAFAIPFAGSFIDLAPPWPAAVALLTAVFEVVCLVIVYIFLDRTGKRTARRVIVSCIPIAALGLGGYLILYSMFVFAIPTTGERVVAGFECTATAREIVTAEFLQSCPFLNADVLASANYAADRIWTKPSIALVRLSLFGTWLAFFCAVTTTIATALAHQRHGTR